MSVAISGYADCHKCTAVKRQQRIQEELDTYHGGTIKVASIYLGANHPLDLVCECGNRWTIKRHRKGESHGCSICGCHVSYGEKYFLEESLKLGLPVETSARFKGLLGVGGGNLSYDFKVGNFLVEINGSQHYRPSTMGHMSYEKAVDKFATQRRHDLRKIEYAVNNGFFLYHIPYNGIISNSYKESVDEVLDIIVKYS